MMFSQAVDGLVRALKPRLTETAKDEIKALGIDLRKPLDPGYTLPVWVQVMRYGAQLIAPHRSEAEQMEELGRRFIDGYEETIVGRALLATMRLLGPRRTLERMSRNFRTGNNYTEAKLVAKGDTEFELWLSSVRAPAFYRGMLMAGIGRTGAKDLEVKVVGHDEQGATFNVSWKA